MEEHQEQTFNVISELLEDKTLKISMLAGLGPVWDGEVEKGVNGVKKELINYWEEEARKGRTIEEYARHNNSLLDLGKPNNSITDEFPEKFQTAFAPPPHFHKVMLQFF